jgi:hypothetical protein
MNRIASQSFRSLAVLAAALLWAACADEAPLGPERGPAPAAQLASDAGGPAVDLEGCENLNVPTGEVLALRLYAVGTQIYRWNGTAWIFIEPSAVLYPNARSRGRIGTHYAGPTWESNSGSKVVGAVLERCTPDPDAIPWLLLRAASAQGPGVFQKITSLQRVNTVGGKAPADPGSFEGQTTEVPYTAEYLFYRAP